jgi:predicted nucleotidyltransferase
MATIFDVNFLEFLDCLNKREAKYILIGGLAVIIHGVNRTTGDMDIFIEPSVENANKVLNAINDFGFGSIGFTIEDILNPDIVVQMGRVPLRIDILSELPGIIFSKTFEQALELETEGIKIKVIHINDLITNKEIVGRGKDILDVKALKEIIRKNERTK